MVVIGAGKLFHWVKCLFVVICPGGYLSVEVARGNGMTYEGTLSMLLH